jgi:hypothetical protein
MMSRKIEDLVAVYGDLGEPSGSGDLYSARPINGRPRYLVAKDPHGNPAILVATETPSSETVSPPLELLNLSFRSRCFCRVRSEGAPESIETLAVLKCSTNDRLLREYFLRSASGLVAALPDAPSDREIAYAVDKLVELFRTLEAPPRASLQGLWCELFLIARSYHIRQAAAAWHADPHALHDFVAGRQRVEVKSSLGFQRNHHFLLDQLLPPHGTIVVIASFLLEESGRGMSVAELWDEISGRAELTADLRNRLAQILALSLGRDWRKARRVAFDIELADERLRLYDAATVPKVDSDLPTGVAEVRFKSDLTGAVHIPRVQAARHGGLFAALFSRT